MHIGILLFDDVEVLDACGPYEVFTTAARVAARRGEDATYDVSLLAATDRAVRSRPGLRLGVDATLDAAGPLDLLLVPGGVTDAVEADATTLAWLAAQAGTTPLLASVCTGAFVLAEAGVLAGRGTRRVTTHWEDVPLLRERHPDLDVIAGPRWVRDGDVWTSAGISAGLDLALELVAVTSSRDLAVATARQMDYAWDDVEAPAP
ncbi:DJ-1/PfpI family protein [Nocardioides zeae]|uniref:DJ-1/PfpI family protein n=1 Tax=Nocardioides imazamoxiresistens TaxID=3231893 RepID=A0ABU3PYT9_9ACTN|nr:DJ-1/PfpI family protein [Nocardioides zeae]MDT9594346.1 DJ-1/PfpI family protein [Nocardioides zeae]